MHYSLLSSVVNASMRRWGRKKKTESRRTHPNCKTAHDWSLNASTMEMDGDYWLLHAN